MGVVKPLYIYPLNYVFQEIKNVKANATYGYEALLRPENGMDPRSYINARIAMGGTHQIEIDSFHRNCGNGKKLMEYMINHVDKDITLEVKNDNDPAIKLYKKNGFKEVATRKGYYQGTDGILMERKKTS